MELTLLLSKVFGLYLIIGGAAVMFRKRYFIPVIGAFVEERLTRMVVAVIELIGGLFLVVSHTNWDSLAAGIVSVFGWAFLVEGSLFMILSDDFVEKYIKFFNTKTWYVFGGILGIGIGIYLTGFGFGWF